MAGYVQNAILTGFKELREIWEVMPILVSDNTNLVNDVQGTIIYTFENGYFFDE